MARQRKNSRKSLRRAPQRRPKRIRPSKAVRIAEAGKLAAVEQERRRKLFAGLKVGDLIRAKYVLCEQQELTKSGGKVIMLRPSRGVLVGANKGNGVQKSAVGVYLGAERISIMQGRRPRSQLFHRVQFSKGSYLIDISDLDPFD